MLRAVDGTPLTVRQSLGQPLDQKTTPESTWTSPSQQTPFMKKNPIN